MSVWNQLADRAAFLPALWLDGESGEFQNHHQRRIKE
jgi:hypothetical protein